MFEFFKNKSLKNHNSENICIGFCLAPNERELSNLHTLSISFEGPIGQSRYSTFKKENENHVFLFHVKKSKLRKD